jgi:hypothetical protein
LWLAAFIHQARKKRERERSNLLLTKEYFHLDRRFGEKQFTMHIPSSYATIWLPMPDLIRRKKAGQALLAG